MFHPSPQIDAKTLSSFGLNRTNFAATGHTNTPWPVVSNCGTHLAQNFLMHKYVCKIWTTCSIETDSGDAKQYHGFY